MSASKLVWNGIDGSTGEYLRAPATRAELMTIARERWIGRVDGAEPEQEVVRTRGPMPGVDPRKLATAGWGVVFAPGVGGDVRDALGELLDHRKAQAGEMHPRYYREFRGRQSPRASESGWAWLTRHGVGPGPVSPHELPYYLLLVGDAEAISFDLQFQLASHCAVGRLWLETPEEYRAYAHSVVKAERASAGSAPRAVFFGVRNPDDPATEYASEELVRPLVRRLRRDVEGWQLETVPGERANKKRLGRLLAGRGETPALLFTTSHGMGFSAGDPRLESDFGALLCHDWPGPKTWHGRIPAEHYFAAADVPADADLSGLVAFHFACYSAGMPQHDSFAHEKDGEPRVLAPRPMLARLPQRLLGRAAGGALAVVGHIDRARGYSFLWPEIGSQPLAFAAVVQLLMEGWPVGWAVRSLVDRYAEIVLRLAEQLRPTHTGAIDDVAVADLWTAALDARSYGVFGDPAVRLRVGG